MSILVHIVPNDGHLSVAHSGRMLDWRTTQVSAIMKESSKICYFLGDHAQLVLVVVLYSQMGV